MTAQELDVKPVNNYVLVKPHMDMESSNTSLRLDTSFDVAAHACRKAEVIAVPDKLDFDPRTTKGMPWDTEMELRVGDEVIYHYLSAITAESNNTERYLDFNGERYFFIKYDRIFVAKRKWWTDGIEPVCLNGFILVEPVQDKTYERFEGGILSIPRKLDKYYGRVKYTGSRIKDYGNIYKNYHGPDRDDIEVGDIVVMDKSCDIPLEVPIHASLDGDSVFYRVQRRYIIGKIKN